MILGFDGNYSERGQALQPSATLQITARAKELRAAGRDVVSLSAGEPDFPTPDAAIQAATRAMKMGWTGYTASAGMPELRSAVAESWSRRRDLEYSSAQVLVSCGAKHSISNLLLAMVNPGEMVLIPKPYWVSYPEMVKIAGGVPVLPVSGGMLITCEDILVAASKGARGMILNSPSNPSGLVYSRDEIERIAAAVAETGIWVISDDIYEDLVFTDCPPPHVLDFRPDLADRVAVVSGVSKSYSMTGWRIGFALAEKGWIRIAGMIQAHSTSNPCTISQYAALPMVLGEAENERESMLGAFRARRDIICSLLEEEERLEVIVPHGAFYVFPRILSDREVDTARFCQILLEEEGLAVIPGSAFGSEGYVRLSFAASEEHIREGVRRLRSFLSRGDL
jgi:aspartate aminotransferase